MAGRTDRRVPGDGSTSAASCGHTRATTAKLRGRARLPTPARAGGIAESSGGARPRSGAGRGRRSSTRRQRTGDDRSDRPNRDSPGAVPPCGARGHRRRDWIGAGDRGSSRVACVRGGAQAGEEAEDRGYGAVPLWRYEPDGGELGLWDLTGSHTAVFTRAAGLAALNLRSGDEIWARGDLGASVPPLHAGKGKALISDLNEFHLISTRTGQVRWTEKGFGTQEKLVYQTLITAGRGVFYFLAEAQDAKNDGEDSQWSPTAWALARRCGGRRSRPVSRMPSPDRSSPRRSCTTECCFCRTCLWRPTRSGSPIWRSTRGPGSICGRGPTPALVPERSGCVNSYRGTS